MNGDGCEIPLSEAQRKMVERLKTKFPGGHVEVIEGEAVFVERTPGVVGVPLFMRLGSVGDGRRG